MARRFLAYLGVLTIVGTGLFLASGAFETSVGAQPATSNKTTVAKTPWGDPDLQGIWSPGYYLTPLQRPNKYSGREFLTDEEVATLERQAAAAPGRNARLERGSVDDVEGAFNDAFTGRGTKVIRTKRTSLIVEPKDGKIPPLTPDAQQRAESSRRARALATPAELAAAFVDRDPAATPYPVDRTMGGGTANPEDRPADRCRGISLPFMGSSGTFSRFVQTPGWMSIYYEDGHRGGAYRHIPLDGRPHLPPQMRQWLGHSVGRWDGDTLIVDTTNFTAQTDFQGSRDNLHLVERFTRTAPDLIVYRATIEDPTTFTAPWTFELPLSKANEKANQIFEAACHEGNYALTGILAGARLQEKQGRAGRH
ncbi:MAG: hypothetical protein DMF90_15445 [Acidobacteria bacterium]|nr:MAG: hypothetical protein DMF90_15445 [Acidobacteriota bacterium]